MEFYTNITVVLNSICIFFCNLEVTTCCSHFGVSQVSNLGPHLFLISINDILTQLLFHSIFLPLMIVYVCKLGLNLLKCDVMSFLPIFNYTLNAD